MPADTIRTAKSFRPSSSTKWTGAAIALAAFAFGLCLAQDHAGSWNDGSRLATIESLVDRGTLAIDESIFVRPPTEAGAGRPLPYSRSEPNLWERGTLDKLWIEGRFYSDKPMVPAIVSAGLYWILQKTTGLVARERPDRFSWWMTAGSSSIAFATATLSVYAIARRVGLGDARGIAMAASFSLATVAPVYAEYVNAHIALLGVAATATWLSLEIALARASDARPWAAAVGLGLLSGFGYALEQGAGPMLLLCTAAWLSYRWPLGLAAFAVAVAPWLALHHAINFAVGGSFSPANANPEYLRWPGSPFTPDNMTGGWNHSSALGFASYAAALLVGKKGFLLYNLPLVGLLGAGGIFRRRLALAPELRLAAASMAGVWLLYALLSNNSSGACCSIRWFVPMLGPAQLILAVMLREEPWRWRPFAILTGWGVVLSAMLVAKGPWWGRMPPGFWPIVAAALVHVLVDLWWTRRRERGIARNAPYRLRAA